MPRVSVVVRTKDRPTFLRRALADIANQTYTDWEVVVVNDGGNGEAVRAAVAEYTSMARVSVIDSVAPGGRCAAANAGIRAATGEYVVLHDDDDLWHPEFLGRTTAALSASPADAGVMVETEIVYERPEGAGWVETHRVPYWQGLVQISFTALLEVNRAVPISFLYRKALHDELGPYDETLDTVEDWDFYLRVTARYPIVFLSGTPLAFWTQRPSETGPAGNSMFELASQHERDDWLIRDRALRQWVVENGPGLPLYIASVEKRIRADFAVALERHAEVVVGELLSRHPIWRRLARLKRRGS
jgi:glycosyltransferase involved in cell wall biosynthesis